MRPIIGVTSSKELGKEKYQIQLADTEAILHAGGLPIMLPHLTEEADIDQIAEHIDGLFAAGGYDVDPTLFGEEPHPNLGTIIPSRDAFELALIQKVLELGKPILGVCRGAQILNVAVGGDMYQDIPAQKEGDVLQHQQKAPVEHGSHFVHVEEGSLLHRLTGTEKLRVNSRHHQANRHVPDSFLISGTASDGVIEAIESKAHHFVLGLQWHPENMAIASDEPSQKIFKGFVEACVEEGDE
ncbi:gamma-glutamyl-gamma-aminobutyrate hydrolase family protein [Planococcus shenhongbingii]|uniref:Gamma-glutamyl-gamma-aminobutyrate hydrolase family protein n=1 Tax=Planococcus shenhongbingii TaxID=3058398 RepID=A0ABT8NAN7_9BACL|nr:MULTISPECIES: gamma-glutamyl-gamma-aminobutyrate hydrolase family protein [unclassified Planococcus (in: firmicutes)]MDN7244953.1 gamma-glutamyl-gamma-aminobutyrate hydrolase family protein [Planococcus sp. N017]WKA58054.1 gamma-glutamyl-gamma-aminobutyrate hydrolase family protein [Planococcus sp. N016]